MYGKCMRRQHVPNKKKNHFPKYFCTRSLATTFKYTHCRQVGIRSRHGNGTQNGRSQKVTLTTRHRKNAKVKHRRDKNKMFVVPCGWYGLQFQVTGEESQDQIQKVHHRKKKKIQRSEPRCTLMLGERCVWFK